MLPKRIKTRTYWPGDSGAWAPLTDSREFSDGEFVRADIADAMQDALEVIAGMSGPTTAARARWVATKALEIANREEP